MLFTYNVGSTENIFSKMDMAPKINCFYHKMYINVSPRNTWQRCKLYELLFLINKNVIPSKQAV